MIDERAGAGRLGEWLDASRLVKYGAFTGLGALALLGAFAARDRSLPEVASAPAEAPILLDRLATIDPARLPSEASSDAPLETAEPSAVVHERSDGTRTPATQLDAPTPNARRTAAPAMRAPSAPSPGNLRAELRLLESAQAALRAGRADDAQRALDDHARRFESGELALEAELLSVQVSLARGDRERAKTRAQRLLARPGAARYRRQLELLVPAKGEMAPRSGGSESALPAHEGAEVIK
jgi:hypothetical protein